MKKKVQAFLEDENKKYAAISHSFMIFALLSSIGNFLTKEFAEALGRSVGIFTFELLFFIFLQYLILKGE